MKSYFKRWKGIKPGWHSKERGPDDLTLSSSSYEFWSIPTCEESR